MARFRGTVQGSRGLVSRLGGASGGLTASVNGWNVGVKVFAFVDENGRDFIDIKMTRGSNGRSSGLVHLATIRACPDSGAPSGSCSICTLCNGCTYHGRPCIKPGESELVAGPHFLTVAK